MRRRNNFKDVAKKAMKCTNKQVTPILHLQSGTAEVCLTEKKRKYKYSFSFLKGRITNPAVTDLYFFLSQIICDWCDSIFIPVNESAKGFLGLELSLMIET